MKPTPTEMRVALDTIANRTIPYKRDAAGAPVVSLAFVESMRNVARDVLGMAPQPAIAPFTGEAWKDSDIIGGQG